VSEPEGAPDYEALLAQMGEVEEELEEDWRQVSGVPYWGH
jgi:hypothetical protein